MWLLFFMGTTIYILGRIIKRTFCNLKSWKCFQWAECNSTRISGYQLQQQKNPLKNTLNTYMYNGYSENNQACLHET